MDITVVNPPSRLPASSNPARTRRAAVLAAGAYLAAWLIGLVVAPASPGAFAPTGEVYAFFVENRGAALQQSFLVHGVAGLALASWVIAVARLVGARGEAPSRVGTLAGLTAAVLSFVQLILQAVLTRRAVTGSVDGTDWAFDAINRVDTIKLLALGLLVAAFTSAARKAGRSGRGLTGMGTALAFLLPVSGAAFLIDSDLLTGLLYLSLPLLLVWVAAMTTVLYRRLAPVGSGRTSR